MRKTTPRKLSALARRYAAVKAAGADRWDGKNDRPAKDDVRIGDFVISRGEASIVGATYRPIDPTREWDE